MDEWISHTALGDVGFIGRSFGVPMAVMDQRRAFVVVFYRSFDPAPRWARFIHAIGGGREPRASLASAWNQDQDLEPAHWRADSPVRRTDPHRAARRELTRRPDSTELDSIAAVVIGELL